MTVADLIAKLSEFDPHWEVRIADWNEEYMHPGLLNDIYLTSECVVLNSKTTFPL